MSDIHGEYKLFQKMLKAISFGENDELYICGDIIDKGDSSVRLAKYISEQNNIHCIIGNHEDAFLKYYRFLMENEEDGNFSAVLEKLSEYFPEGEPVDWALIDWLESLPYYIVTEDFICVHAGIPILENGQLQPLENTREESLIHDRKFKNPGEVHLSPKCVFFGHTQTDCVSGKARILAYPRSNASKPYRINDFYKIHLDTGAWSNGVLACFCVDTCKAYYVCKA